MRCLRCFGNGTIVQITGPGYDTKCPNCGGSGSEPDVRGAIP
ncbi:MAG TPA: hypothetical protein VGR28_09860 [Candidatus Thermoplasmatota archaeon]|nr:hypothetical protein [Candidatus Thermoplasmatota archaeon]